MTITKQHEKSLRKLFIFEANHNYIFRAATEQPNHQFGRVLSSARRIGCCHQVNATRVGE